MNQYEGECRCAIANKSIMEENISEKLLGGFSREIGSMENNNNCIFNLKQNRKFPNQNSLKRLRCLKKNKVSDFILHKDSQEHMPPKAPENRTQYLSNLKKDFGDLNILEKQKQKIVHQKLSNLNTNNNNDEEKTIQLNKKLTRKTSFSDANTTTNKNNALISNIYANKENLPNADIFTRRNSNYLASANDCENYFSAAADFEKSDFFNFYPEDDFLTGSTMKSIVESITKSKNKILSNSLNLDDGNQSNLCFSTNKENIPSHASTAKKNKNKVDKEKAFIAAENFAEMNFKISDFIPDLELDLLETNPFFTNNENENYSAQQQQNEFFHLQNLIKFDSELAENSTKEASNENTPLETRSPPSLLNFRENELFPLQNSVEESFIFGKENFQFFLLGNKKKRSFSFDEHAVCEENKEKGNKKYFCEKKNS